MIRSIVTTLVLALGCSTANCQPTVAPGSTIFVESELYKALQAAFQAQHVPLRIVTSPEIADYKLVTNVVHNSETVSTPSAGDVSFQKTYETVQLTKSDNSVWKYVVSNRTLKQGDHSVASTIARHIKEVIVKGSKP